MPFVLIKTDSPDRGYYVATEGSQKSYTRSLHYARIFNTREEASANACGNEHPYELSQSLMQSTRGLM